MAPANGNPNHDHPLKSLSNTSDVSRRAFLGAAAGAVAISQSISAFGRDYGPNAEPVRYPDPDIVSLDPRFDKYKLGNTPIQRIHQGNLWAEGPAWNSVGRYLIWSDIPNDVQRRWINDDGHVSTFRQPVGNSNGNTFDYQGRQLSCEHGNRRLVRYEYDGKVTVLADQWQNKPLNAPNDVVVHPHDGSIWFTDPGYGSLMNYEGNKGELHLKEAVYRIDGQTGKMDIVTDEIFKPNGLCFSPDYRRLYIADTGSSHYPNAPKNIKVWDVVDNKKLANGREFTSMELDGKSGLADGIRADEDGNVWASAGWVGDGYDGVHIFAPNGDRIGMIRLPEICSNVCFGGPKRNRLFMTASQSVYAVYVETRGAHIS
ncbi:MAG: SMP-30/gluconolactonase/LRE family protein [Planctomycetales bacterium]|nr:SMP-30/gluconolactonase/LRE family protein [Planctomycetales bacterium]MCA9166676.1 SMP-30/gluconolactonase/LRE family protein [Planctomycetales bacterium]